MFRFAKKKDIFTNSFELLHTSEIFKIEQLLSMLICVCIFFYHIALKKENVFYGIFA